MLPLFARDFLQGVQHRIAHLLGRKPSRAGLGNVGGSGASRQRRADGLLQEVRIVAPHRLLETVPGRISGLIRTLPVSPPPVVASVASYSGSVCGVSAATVIPLTAPVVALTVKPAGSPVAVYL